MKGFLGNGMRMVSPHEMAIHVKTDILNSIGPQLPGSTDVEFARVLYARREDHGHALGGIYGNLPFSAQ